MDTPIKLSNPGTTPFDRVGVVQTIDLVRVPFPHDPFMSEDFKSVNEYVVCKRFCM